MGLWVILFLWNSKHIFVSFQPCLCLCHVFSKANSRFLHRGPPASRRPGATPPFWQKKTLASSRPPRHQRRLHQRRGRERMFAQKVGKLLGAASHPLSTIFGAPVGPVPRLQHPQASQLKEEITGMMRSTISLAMTATRRYV